MSTQENQALMIKDFGLFIFYRGFASIGKPRPGDRLAREIEHETHEVGGHS
jgi:hypothetical protein